MHAAPTSPLVVALAGLPGAGKTTLATPLAAALGAALLSKDRVREALFGPDHVAYDRGQDDFVVEVLLDAARHLFASGAGDAVVLDGRTFSRRAQVDRLRAFADGEGARLRWIECVCADEAARTRLERPDAHPARDRSFELYLRLRAEAEPLPPPKLVLETDRAPVDELVRRAVEFARGS